MDDELDLDELYNESCVLNEILPHLVIDTHPVGELRAQELRSRSAFPKYACSEIKVKMNLVMNCAEFHKYILGKTRVLAAVKTSVNYADVGPPQW